MTIRKTADGRTISGFKMKLYPGFAEEYEKRHNELWPEMADMLHLSLIHISEPTRP